MAQARKKDEKEGLKDIPKNVKIITWSILGAIVIGIISVLLWMEYGGKKEPTLPERFENIEHISTDIFEVMLGEKFSDELSEDDLELWDEIKDDLERDIYIFIYNQDYEESPDSEKLEDLVKEVYNKEDKGYTIFVLNYLKNINVEELLEGENIRFPTMPALVHVEGEEIAENGVNSTYNTILVELNKLKG